MPAFDPPPPPQRAPPRTLVTTSGVTVVVNPPSTPPPPPPSPEPVEPFPRAIILPMNLSPAEREAWLSSLCEEYRHLVGQMLARRRDVLPESAKDLQHEVLMVLYTKAGAGQRIDNVEGFLAGVVTNEVRNHKREWRPPVEREADPDAERSLCDPEWAAELAERTEKLERHLAALPVKEAQVFRCVRMLEMTLEETAAWLGRPLSTVAHQLERAEAKIADRVRESARATDAGERRKPPR